MYDFHLSSSERFHPHRVLAYSDNGLSRGITLFTINFILIVFSQGMDSMNMRNPFINSAMSIEGDQAEFTANLAYDQTEEQRSKTNPFCRKQNKIQGGKYQPSHNRDESLFDGILPLFIENYHCR